MKRAFLCLAIAGCATFGSSVPVVDVPRAAEAEALVWQLYGKPAPMPQIFWKTGDRLDCVNDGRKGFKALVVGGSGCVFGATEVPSVVNVAWEPGQPISDTSLAHELLHSRWLLDGVADPLHRLPALWGPGGQLDQANALLKKSGL